MTAMTMSYPRPPEPPALRVICPQCGASVPRHFLRPGGCEDCADVAEGAARALGSHAPGALTRQPTIGRDMIRRAFAVLTDAQKDVLRWRYIERRYLREIGDMLGGIHKMSVHSRIFRIKRRMSKAGLPAPEQLFSDA